MKMIAALFIIVNCLWIPQSPLWAQTEFKTTAEASNFEKTSTYADVMSFIYQAQKQSDLIRLATLTQSSEGRLIPLVIVSTEGIKSPAEQAASGKPAVLIMANIHAGEIEGKEAVLMLIRDFVQRNQEAMAMLQHQVVLIIPIFNSDGNDKFGKNRDDNGPELAGVRYNGQDLDLNRDFLKLHSPEVRALVALYQKWDPVLFVDLHTTNGSYHRETLTYTTQVNPNGSNALSMYMWNKMFPATAKMLKDDYGIDSCPYGNFVDRTKPEKGWANHAFEARYGTNYTGLRNRFTILDENYSHADFKTRVLSSYGFIRAILRYTDDHIDEMKKMTLDADFDTKENYYKQPFALEFKTDKLFDFVIKSYEFKLEKIKPQDRQKYPPWVKDYIVKKTDKFKDYNVDYFNKAVPTRSVNLPEAYVIPPFSNDVVENLKRHGIIVERIIEPVKQNADVFETSEIKTADSLYQGNVAITLSGKYAVREVTITAGSYFVSMKQPLARLIPVLLEPESTDSLASWGFLNKKLVSQWSRNPNPYPIYRLMKVEQPIQRIQD